MPPRAGAKKGRGGRASLPSAQPSGDRVKATRASLPSKVTRFADQEYEDEEEGDLMEEDEDEASTFQALAAAYKNKASASSTRTPSIVTKTDQLIATTRQALAKERNDAIDLTTTTLAGLSNLFASDPMVDLSAVARQIGERNIGVSALEQIYSTMIKETAVRKDQAVEDADQLLSAQVAARAKSGRKTMRRARQNLEEGHEYQKLASDAQELIKHYKKLVRI